MPARPAAHPTAGARPRSGPISRTRHHDIATISGQPGGMTKASRVDCLRAVPFRRAQPSADAKLQPMTWDTTEADG
jgi:hypothetical protein